MKLFRTTGESEPTVIPHFDGKASLIQIGGSDPDFELSNSDSIYFVQFREGAMNHWHTHKSRQILLFTDGKGLVEERDGEKALLNPGDAVRTEPGVVHRHGAAPGENCTHVAIQEGAAEWLD